jgi:poly-beta-1,6-N-acetyl-D-glucosamine synthase
MSRYIVITLARDEEAFLPTCKKYDYVLRLDADISFEPDFSDLLLTEFASDPRLGIAGPTRYEPKGAEWREIRQPEFHTRGAAKMYSSRCYASIGGLDADIGWDTLDEARAMMIGPSAPVLINCRRRR